MQKFNPKLVPLKLLYFTYYAGLSSFIPFKSIYQKQLGMSEGQNGVIQALFSLVSLFSPPLAGYITDRTKAYKVVMTVCMGFSVVFTLPFYFVPSVEREILQKDVICCKSTVYNIFNCANITESINCKINNMTVTAFSDTNNSCTSPDSVLACDYPDPEPVYGFTFGMLIFLTCALSFFFAPVTPLVDSSAMDTLGIEKVNYFGVQRLWGAVGFGVIGLIVGYLTDLLSPEEFYGIYEKNYIASFLSATLFLGIAIVITVTSVDVAAPKAKMVMKGIGKLIIKPKVLAFLFVVLVSGFGTGVQYSFVFWYLQSLGGFKQYILGLTLLITCLSEIPMFWFSGWICRKFGYVTVLVLGLVAVSIRFFMYTVITEAWHVLLVEWLHGISFALPNAAICSYAAVIAPKDAIATLISISMSVYFGLGNMIGAFLGGVLYKAYGGVQLFRICCAICLITAILYEAFFGHGNLYKCFQKEKSEAKSNIVKVDETKLAARPEEQQLQPHTEEEK